MFISLFDKNEYHKRVFREKNEVDRSYALYLTTRNLSIGYRQMAILKCKKRCIVISAKLVDIWFEFVIGRKFNIVYLRRREIHRTVRRSSLMDRHCPINAEYRSKPHTLISTNDVPMTHLQVHIT